MAFCAKDGGRVAQTEFFAALYPSVRKHVGFTLGFSLLTEDAVQESMLEIYRAFDRFRGDSSPITWALSIASRTARRYEKRQRKHVCEELQLEVASEGVYESLSQMGEVVLLSNVLKKIAPKKREAFLLMAVFELSASEAAKVTGAFSGTMASRFRNAKAELEAVYLGDMFPDSPFVDSIERKGLAL